MLGVTRIRAGLAWGRTISLLASVAFAKELMRNAAQADNRDAK